MTIDDFWKLIARIDRRLLKRGDDDAAIRPLVAALAGLEKADLQSFQEHLAQVLNDLDGRAYFDASVEAAGSDDSFLYVRCYVVAMGQDVYRRTLRKPRLMPRKDGQWCESLLYAARSAWQQKTGEDEEFNTQLGFESGSNEALWPREDERDWREETKAEIKMWRRDAKESRRNARRGEHAQDWLRFAENSDRMADELQKKLGDEPSTTLFSAFRNRVAAWLRALMRR